MKDVLPTDGSDPNETISIEIAEPSNGHHEDIEETFTDSQLMDGEIEDIKTISHGRRETLPPLLQRVENTGSGFLEEYSALDELLNEGKGAYSLDFRTELNEMQIVQFARARIMSDHFNIPALRYFVEHLERLSVSKNRKGRKEFADAFKSANSDGGPMQSIGQSMTDKLRS